MKIRINNFLFYTAYIFSSIAVMFTRVRGISHYLKVFDILSIGLFALLFIYQNFIMGFTISKKRFLFLLFLLGVCIASSVSTRDFYPLKLFLVLSTFRNIEIDDFIKKDFIVKIVMFLSIIFLYHIGLADKVLIARADGKIRSALGFSHANIFGNFLLVLCFEFIYLMKGKRNMLSIFILLSSILLDYFVADSRASIIVLIFALVFLVFNLFNNTKFLENKVVKFLVSHSFLILTIFALGLVFLYNRQNLLALRLDHLFSTRIYWASKYIHYYGFSLLGRDLFLPQVYTILASGPYLCVDISYIYFILKYGLIIFFVIAFFMRKTILKIYEMKDYRLIFLLLLTFAYGLMETYLLKFQYNPFLIILGITLVESNARRDEENES